MLGLAFLVWLLLLTLLGLARCLLALRRTCGKPPPEPTTTTAAAPAAAAAAAAAPAAAKADAEAAKYPMDPTLSSLGAYGSVDAIARTTNPERKPESFHSLRKQVASAPRISPHTSPLYLPCISPQVTHELQRLGSSALLVRKG